MLYIIMNSLNFVLFHLGRLNEFIQKLHDFILNLTCAKVLKLLNMNCETLLLRNIIKILVYHMIITVQIVS